MNSLKQHFTFNFHKMPSNISSLLSISANYITAMTVEQTKVNFLLQLSAATLLYYLYLLLTFARLIIVVLILTWHLLPNYLHYDLLLAFFVRKHFIDSNLALVLGLADPMVFYLDYSVHVLRGLRCFRLGHDLLVVNVDRFFSLNPQLGVWECLRYICCNQSDGNDRNNVLKLNTPKLAHFPHLHHSIRCRAVLFSAAFNVFIAIYVVSFGLFFLFFIGYYFVTHIWPVYSLLPSLIFLLDFLFLGYIFWNTTKIAIFYAHAINLIIYVLVAQQAVMNQSLQILLNAKSRKSSLSYIQLVIYLERYIAVNFQFISNILIINKEFVSFVLMIAIVTMLGK